MTVWWDFNISVEQPDGADEQWAENLLEEMIRVYCGCTEEYPLCLNTNWVAGMRWEIIGDEDEDDWHHAEDCDMGHDCSCRDDLT